MNYGKYKVKLYSLSSFCLPLNWTSLNLFEVLIAFVPRLIALHRSYLVEYNIIINYKKDDRKFK